MSTAVVVEAPGAHRLVPHDPVAPGPGEALVGVHAVGICGSDREVYQGNRPEGTSVTPSPRATSGRARSGRSAPGYPRAWSAAKWSGRASATARSATAATPVRPPCAHRLRGDRLHRPGAMAATLTLPARLLHVPGGRGPDGRGPPGAGRLRRGRRAEGEPRARRAGRGRRHRHARHVRRAVPEGRLPCRTAGGRFRDRPRGAVPAVRGHRLPHQGPGTHPDFDVVVVETAGSASAARTAASLLRRGGRLVLTGIPAPGAEASTPPISSYGSWRCTPCSGRRRTPGRTRYGSSAPDCSIRCRWSPRVAPRRVLPGHRAGGSRRSEGRQGPPATVTSPGPCAGTESPDVLRAGVPPQVSSHPESRTLSEIPNMKDAL